VTNYRRNFICGGSFFFTANLAERRLRLLVDYIDLLRQAFRYFVLRWRLIKSMFSRGLPAGERRSASRAQKSERGIWQRRYWEHTLRDEEDFARHADYIHFNPVKHGHVSRVRDWPYSSFHRMVRFGVYPLDWAGDAADNRSRFGER
jgi:putative transposase